MTRSVSRCFHCQALEPDPDEEFDLEADREDAAQERYDAWCEQNDVSSSDLDGPWLYSQRD